MHNDNVSCIRFANMMTPTGMHVTSNLDLTIITSILLADLDERAINIGSKNLGWKLDPDCAQSLCKLCANILGNFGQDPRYGWGGSPNALVEDREGPWRNFPRNPRSAGRLLPRNFDHRSCSAEGSYMDSSRAQARQNTMTRFGASGMQL